MLAQVEFAATVGMPTIADHTQPGKSAWCQLFQQLGRSAIYQVHTQLTVSTGVRQSEPVTQQERLLTQHPLHRR